MAQQKTKLNELTIKEFEEIVDRKIEKTSEYNKSEESEEYDSRLTYTRYIKEHDKEFEELRQAKGGLTKKEYEEKIIQKANKPAVICLLLLSFLLSWMDLMGAYASYTNHINTLEIVTVKAIFTICLSICLMLYVVYRSVVQSNK